jgi:hypothetical protein
MKPALGLCIAAASILVFGATTAHARPRHHKKRALSAAAPAAAIELPGKGDAKIPDPTKPSFWLAADPHVPLATVLESAIRPVGKRGVECGDAGRWATPGSRWHAVDAWGQKTGLYEVSGAEAFDVTTCREVSFTARSGKPGVGLYVSDDSGYAPASSAAYSASVGEKKRFERFLGSMESSWVNQKPLGKLVPLAKRTLFFQFDAPKDARWEGRVDGAGKPLERPRRWAVAGGPMLVVAYLGAKGHWKVASVKAPLGLADSYTPIAVFDMNGDGIPEIVVRANDGASFADKVLRFQADTMSWEEVAVSPGGSVV